MGVEWLGKGGCGARFNLRVFVNGDGFVYIEVYCWFVDGVMVVKLRSGVVAQVIPRCTGNDPPGPNPRHISNDL